MTLAALLSIALCAPPVQEQDALARMGYAEARGESLRGQLAVAWTARNRAESEGRLVSEVLRDRGQYALIRGEPKDRKAWLTANRVAWAVLCGAQDPTGGATHFHALRVKPHWARRFRRHLVIDGHVFYSRGDK